MLGEHDRRAPLLVEPAQQPDELVAGDRIELRRRLVEQHDLRAARERGAERDALELAPGELVGRAVQQLADAQGQRGLLHASRDRGRSEAAVLERKGQLGPHRPQDDLRLGILKEAAGDHGDVAGAAVAHRQPAHDDLTLHHPAVQVGHQAARGAQQGRLARRRAPGEHDELARADGERDVGQGRR